MDSKIKVSVVIVSFNTREQTIACIRSVIAHTREISYEIIVSDNGSTDESVETIEALYPDVILLKNGSNLGFARANNKGLDVAGGKYVFYLNSDTRLENNAIKMFYDYWEKSEKSLEIGALGAQLLDGNHKLTHSGAAFPTYKRFCMAQFRGNIICAVKLILKSLRLDNAYIESVRRRDFEKIHRNQAGEIDYITGADLFLKNDENARFNEQYFMYCEETELELKLSRKGLKRIIIDGPKIIHDQNKTHEDSIRVYRPSDCYKEFSSVIYSQNNLVKNAFVLRILVALNGLNPYVRKVRKQLKYVDKRDSK